MLAVRIHHYGKRDALSPDDIPVPGIALDEALAPVDAVFDTLGGQVQAASWRVLARLPDVVHGDRPRPVVGAAFGLRDMARAHALSESGRATGKIVLPAGTP